MVDMNNNRNTDTTNCNVPLLADESQPTVLLISWL